MMMRLLLTAFSVSALCVFGRKVRSCRGSHNLAQYRVTFRATWNEDDFPKQFPKFRPKAQWSKLIGRSHDENYELWSKGTIADPGFKEFAQEGKIDILEKRETQGFNGIFDTFTGPPIEDAEGETSADFFLNHNFSQVSIAVKLVPSPDWFVGVDSLNLCEHGSWKKTVSVSLDPLDAGTDRGFTFTSPNWASRPQEKIFQVTSRFPDHPANSFYYPDRESLPHIGQLTFELLSEFRHEITHKEVTHYREIHEENLEELEKKREELEEQLILAGEPLGQTQQSDGSSNRVPPRRHIPSPEDNTQSEESSEQHQTLVIQPQTVAIDCLVGDWGPWSPCSKTCGFGAQKRQRRVVQIPKGGRSCPVLDQEKWCGSMRNCRVSGTSSPSLFSWLDKKPKRQRARRMYRKQSQ